jgi:TPP-dependent pyruvate/acetoin dehydrogenase alpha subunit
LVYSLGDQVNFFLYRSMLKIRNVELRIVKEYPKLQMRCPVHLSVGQEIVSAIFSYFAKKKDYVVSSHRSHAHYIAKNGNLLNMVLEIYGKNGCAKGIGGSMHLVDKKINFMGSSAIVGNSIPVGVGLGEAILLEKNKKNLSFIFFGDAATEEGVFYESLNYAALKNIPVIFICENNLYSVYSSLSDRRSNHFSLKNLVKSFGIKYYENNSYNLKKYFKIFREGINYARKNRKPVFFNFFTYRWLEHCGPNYDNDIGYRDLKEFNYWKSKDPLNRLKNEIISSNKLNEKKIKKIEKEINNEINKIFLKASKAKKIKFTKSLQKIFK